MPNIHQFVGRSYELNQILNAVAHHHASVLISVNGRGGIGKTYLLNHAYNQLKSKEGYQCFPTVDFSQGHARTEEALIHFISENAPSAFAGFETKSRGKPQAEIFSDFIECFHALEQENTCIFFFDTLELIQDTLLFEFIVKLVEKSTNSIFILAGRRNSELEPRFNTLDVYTLPIDLKGFSLEDGLRYIQAHATGKQLTDETQTALYYVAENGLPIKLALALDWYASGQVMSTINNVLMDYGIDGLKAESHTSSALFTEIINDFECELVQLIGQGHRSVDNPVYVMAHVYKRFNRELLTRLMPTGTDIDGLISEIKNLEFVKQIEDDYFVLHDEVQRMIEQHIWAIRDPNREARRAISQQVVAYYDDHLRAIHLQQGTPEQVHEDLIFEIERLHYQFDLDFNEAYQQFMQLFNKLQDQRQVSLAALALDVVTNRNLPNRLRIFITAYYGGWVLVRRPYLSRAREEIEKGIKLLNALPELSQDEGEAFLRREVDIRRGEIHTLYGYCLRLMGEWNLAVAELEDGRKFSEALLDHVTRYEQRDVDFELNVRIHLAETLNDIANLYRMQGKMEQARYYCKSSLLIRRQLGDWAKIGHCCYVMGMIMWESGNTSEAMDYLEQARQNYRKVNAKQESAWIDRYEGYVMYRTGNPEKARKLLTQALETVSLEDGFQDEYAETLITLSRIEREDENKQKQALDLAEQALTIAERSGNSYRIAECHLTLALTHMEFLSDKDEFHESAVKDNLKRGFKIATEQLYRRLETMFAEAYGNLIYHEKDYLEAVNYYVLACQLAVEFKPAVFVRTLNTLSRRLYELVLQGNTGTLDLCDYVLGRWENTTWRDKFPALYQEFREEIEYIQKSAQTFDSQQRFNILFDRAYRAGQWNDALQLCDEIDHLTFYDHPEQARVLQNRARVYHYTNNYSEARLYCERAARIYEQYHDYDVEQKAHTYLLLHQIYWKLGNTAEASYFLEQARNLFNATGNLAGLSAVEYEYAYMLFRTHQFDDARRKLQTAQDYFLITNNPVDQARALNLSSRLARVDPEYSDQRETGYRRADNDGRRALEVLDHRDRFVEAEIYLTLCILHFAWMKYCAKHGQASASEKHFEKAVEYNRQGLQLLQGAESPLLQSVFFGMRGNLELTAGNTGEACQNFLRELIDAVKTKHVRLIRTIDLLEDWLASLPDSETEANGRWFISKWKEAGYAEKFPDVIDAIQWLISHRRYIYSAQGSSDMPEDLINSEQSVLQTNDLTVADFLVFDNALPVVCVVLTTDPQQQTILVESRDLLEKMLCEV